MAPSSTKDQQWSKEESFKRDPHVLPFNGHVLVQTTKAYLTSLLPTAANSHCDWPGHSPSRLFDLDGKPPSRQANGARLVPNQKCSKPGWSLGGTRRRRQASEGTAGRQPGASSDTK